MVDTGNQVGQVSFSCDEDLYYRLSTSNSLTPKVPTSLALFIVIYLSISLYSELNDQVFRILYGIQSLF